MKKINNIEISEDVFELFVKAYSNGIDLTEYISDFRRDVCRLSQVYYGLKEGLDVSVFAHSEYTAAAMVEIRYALKNNIDLSFLKSYMNEGMIRNIIFLKENGINIEDYINETTSEQEIRFIGERLLYKETIDYLYKDLSTKEHFKFEKMKTLRKMYKNGFDLNSINTIELNEAQLKEIYKGFITNVDYTLYANKEYDYKIMREIRENLEFGITKIPTKKSKTDQEYIKEIKELREKILNNFDCAEFNLKYALGENYLDKYDKNQLKILKETLNKELPVEKLISDLYSAEQMEEIMYGLEDSLDVSKYLDKSLTDIEMNHIRQELLKEKKDINFITSFIDKYLKQKKNNRLIFNYKTLDKNNLSKNILAIDSDRQELKCFAITKELKENLILKATVEDKDSFVKTVKNVWEDIKDATDEEFVEIVDVLKKEEV